MSILRTFVAAFALVSSASLGAKELPSALFCSGPAQGSAMRLFAGQGLANGDLKFGVTVWQANGQNFSVFGIAKRAPSGWLYEVRESRRVVCRLHIAWRGSEFVRIKGDVRADCQASAGYGFGSKDLRLTSADYRGPVTTQLSDPETFVNAVCPKGRGERG